MNELIEVKQLPVIAEQLQMIKGQVKERVDYALSLDCTEGSYKEVKKVRAELTKDFNDFESKRKAVKKAILAPYEQFEAVYKDCVTNIYSPADKQLAERIHTVENQLKEEREKDIKDFFSEYAQSKDIDFLTFERAGINITLSASRKSLIEKVTAFIDKVADDVELIKLQPYSVEILVEYKKTLNVTTALKTVTERNKAIEEEQAKVKPSEPEQPKEEKAEVLKAPEEISEKIYSVTFRVTTSDLGKLKKLKEFMKKEEINYEQCSD